MLTFAFASLFATRASAPGLLRRRTTNAGSSLARYLARRNARLALTASLTITRTLPRPLTASAESVVMLTPASASVLASCASTPGLDLRLTVSCVALGIGAPPRQGFGPAGIVLGSAGLRLRDRPARERRRGPERERRADPRQRHGIDDQRVGGEPGESPGKRDEQNPAALRPTFPANERADPRIRARDSRRRPRSAAQTRTAGPT